MNTCPQLWQVDLRSVKQFVWIVRQLIR